MQGRTLHTTISHCSRTTMNTLQTSSSTSRGLAATMNNLEDSHELIDAVIATTLKKSKQVYISVSCNLPAIPHSAFSREPVPFSLSPKLSDQLGLEVAVEATLEFLNKAVKPVIVGGPKFEIG